MGRLLLPLGGGDVRHSSEMIKMLLLLNFGVVVILIFSHRAGHESLRCTSRKKLAGLPMTARSCCELGTQESAVNCRLTWLLLSPAAGWTLRRDPLLVLAPQNAQFIEHKSLGEVPATTMVELK